ncbi:MAG: hypothetical protein JXR19_07790 [Bacteroidia bacterium]
MPKTLTEIVDIVFWEQWDQLGVNYIEDARILSQYLPIELLLSVIEG